MRCMKLKIQGAIKRCCIIKIKAFCRNQYKLADMFSCINQSIKAMPGYFCNDFRYSNLKLYVPYFRYWLCGDASFSLSWVCVSLKRLKLTREVIPAGVIIDTVDL